MEDLAAQTPTLITIRQGGPRRRETDAKTNEGLIREAGLAIEKVEIVPQDNEDAKFMWVIARRPP